MSSESPIPNEDILRMAEKEEPRFLNILLKDKDCLSDAVSYGIRYTDDGAPGHFLIPKNNILYKMIYQNFLKYNTVLTRSAMDSIIDMQEGFTDEEKAAIKGYWDKIWNRHDAAMEDYSLLKEHLNDRYILWQFFEVWKNGDQIVKATSNHSSLVKDFIKDLNAMDNISPDPYSLTMSIDEGMKEAMQYIKNRKENPEQNEAILTYIDGIDKIYHGFSRGTYTVISGMINGGKTTLMMNIGFNMAKYGGYNVAYVSLEKDAKLFFRRTLALHAMTDYNRIKTGGNGQWGLTDFWYNKLINAAKELREKIKPLYHCLQFVQNTKLTKILNEVDKLRSRRRIDVLIVDYLQVIGNESNHPTRPDLDLAEIHKRLMAYGRTHGIVIFTALQLKSSSSKEIRKKAEKVTNDTQLASVSVNTEDYSGSQMVIADADNALGVVLNGDKPPTKMFISISKARDDESRRTICLDFDGKLGRVSDPEFGAGQIKQIDDMLFNKDMTEEKLDSEDDLFNTIEKEHKDKLSTKTKKPKEPKEPQEPQKEDGKEEFVDGLVNKEKNDDFDSFDDNPAKDIKKVDLTEAKYSPDDNDDIDLGV